MKESRRKWLNMEERKILISTRCIYLLFFFFYIYAKIMDYDLAFTWELHFFFFFCVGKKEKHHLGGPSGSGSLRLKLY